LWGCGVVPTEDKGRKKALVRTLWLNPAGWKTGTCVKTGTKEGNSPVNSQNRSTQLEITLRVGLLDSAA